MHFLRPGGYHGTGLPYLAVPGVALEQMGRAFRESAGGLIVSTMNSMEGCRADWGIRRVGGNLGCLGFIEWRSPRHGFRSAAGKEE